MNAGQPAVCRSCEHAELQSVLSLGRTPLANALLTEAQLNEPEKTYPLELVFCSHCSLVQLTESVSPKKLFREYVYLSSFSDTMLRHAEQSSSALIGAKNLGAASLVMEVASNDGYLLQYYKRASVPVLGIEPATNIAEVATQRGIRTVCDFFDEVLALRLRDEGLRADVIHAHNGQPRDGSRQQRRLSPAVLQARERAGARHRTSDEYRRSSNATRHSYGL